AGGDDAPGGVRGERAARLVAVGVPARVRTRLSDVGRAELAPVHAAAGPAEQSGRAAAASGPEGAARAGRIRAAARRGRLDHRGHAVRDAAQLHRPSGPRLPRTDVRADPAAGRSAAPRATAAARAGLRPGGL